MTKLKEGDTVSHPYLGLGEVVKIKLSLSQIPIYASVDWDRDPPLNYNMGANPSNEPIHKLTKIEDDTD